MKGIILTHKEIYSEDKPMLAFAKITDVLTGHLPIGNIDVAKNHKVFHWSKN